MSSKYVVDEYKVKANLHIKALIDGEIAPECDPINHAFTWAKGDRGPKVDKELIKVIPGWSRFGYHGLFKPSLGELICSIPDDLVKQVDYVEIADTDAVGTNLTAGVHEFEIMLYKKPSLNEEFQGAPV